MEPVEGDHGLNRLDRLAAVCWQTENAVAILRLSRGGVGYGV